MSTINYEEYIRRNSKRTCKVSSCDELRRGVSAYCPYHGSQRYHYGHAPSKGILLRDFKVELNQVTEVIKRNYNHKGIQQALSFFQYWMDLAYKDYTKVPAGVNMRIARELKAAPMEFLRFTSAMVLLYEGQKRLIKSDLNLIYHIGNRVLICCPCKTSTSRIGTVRRQAGEFCWTGCGLMLNGITQQAIKDEQSLRKEDKNYLAPLT